jgi:LuxR family maltose regulon positive regulatory protein
VTVEALSIGRAALQRGQWQEARLSYETALLTAASPEALEGLGWALYWLEASEASFEKREEAYRLYLQRGDTRAAARVATNLGVDWADFAGLAVAAGWLQRARRLLEPLEEGVEHGWLYLWEGHLVRMSEEDTARARELAARAVVIGRQHSVPDLEFLALALEGLVMVHDGDVSGGMRQLDEATAAALAGEMSDIDTVAQTCCLLVHACERVRDYDRAEQWSHRIERFATRYSTGSMFALCRVQHAAMLIGVGRWSEAERVIEEALELLQIRRPAFVDEAHLLLAELWRRQGKWREAEQVFRRCDSYSEAMLGLAAIALDRGDLETALAQLERFGRKPLAEKWVQRASAVGMRVDLMVRRGDLSEARVALEQLRELAERIGTDIIRAIAAEAAAIVIAAEGDSASARIRLEDAIDLFRKASAPFEEGRARLRLAGVLAAAGCQALAVAEARTAGEIFERLGAAEELRRAGEVGGRLMPPARVSALTARETEVLRLVARGMSDKEVAAELRLSEHTIHRHVSNILGKLKLGSRTAAVAAAAKLGLL